MVIAIALAVACLDRTRLTDPMHPLLFVFCVVAGIGIGVWLSIVVASAVTKMGRDFSMASVIFAIPLFSCFICYYCARVAVEVAYFTGQTPLHSEIKAEVIRKGIGRYGSRSATVFPYPNAKEVYVNIDRELYAKLDPWKSPGRDCLKLHMETGRGGLNRVIVPNLVDNSLGVERLVPCR